MSGPPKGKKLTLNDLVDEAKKRAVLLLVFAVGLSYLMTLTSSSVWLNLPFAISLVILLRYMLLDFDIRRKNTTSSINSLVDEAATQQNIPVSITPSERGMNSHWRKKVNSVPVETAIEQFTRHLVAEWVTDLWYARITPDRDGPEELINVINNVIGEISIRARDINLIELLTRDIIGIICNSLELYQLCQVKIGKEKFVKLSAESRDAELKSSLAAKGKLHPALVSLSAEYKVLQLIADALVTTAFNPDDLKCSFFRCTARELLACAVMRPILNLANPRFINERIEAVALSYANNKVKVVLSSPGVPLSTTRETAMPSDELLSTMDHPSPGVELMQYKLRMSKSASDGKSMETVDYGNMTSSRPVTIKSYAGVSNNSVSANGPLNSRALSSIGLPHSDIVDTSSSHKSEVERVETTGVIYMRKNQSPAPEHFENMWTKGRHYSEKEPTSHLAKEPKQKSLISSSAVNHPTKSKDKPSDDQTAGVAARTASSHMASGSAAHNESEHAYSSEESTNTTDRDIKLDSDNSDVSEEDENSNITGLDSPGIKIWESKNKRNVGTSLIHHPLESSDLHASVRKLNHNGSKRKARPLSGRRRSRLSGSMPKIWQETENTSRIVTVGQDTSHASEDVCRSGDVNDDSKDESPSKASSRANLSSFSYISSAESSHSTNYSSNNILADSFLKLRCEVVGANIVKSGSGMFAVYSVAVMDANNNSWSIKRRFRHFEELHRRLKEFADYNLSLPPKHFWSSGLEVPVVRERCKLLDIYLKKLLLIPSLSSSIEVWDFLSVDSQMYVFSDTLSIIQTLSVISEEIKESGMGAKHQKTGRNFGGDSKFASDEEFERSFGEADGLRRRKGTDEKHLRLNTRKGKVTVYQDLWDDPEVAAHNDFSFSISKSDGSGTVLPDGAGYHEEFPFLDADGYSTTPTDWTPPNLSLSIFRLVDVVFQVQDGAWIRRQAFWVAKQILQLGMGDTFDDWLVEKILLLRKGTVVASLIQRIEQVLWPDGTFITKRRNRTDAIPVSRNTPVNGMGDDVLRGDKQQIEAERRAKFVHELIVENAPSALVSLVGRSEYERCAQDIYFFLQSPVFMKQLAFQLLELILQAAFPELRETIKRLHGENELFRDFE